MSDGQHYITRTGSPIWYPVRLDDMPGETDDDRMALAFEDVHLREERGLPELGSDPEPDPA